MKRHLPGRKARVVGAKATGAATTDFRVALGLSLALLLFQPLGCRSKQAPASAPVSRATGASCADPLPLPLGRTVLGSTAGGGKLLAPSCASAEAPERVYAVDLERRSRLRVSLSAAFDAALSLRQSCTYEDSEVACNDDYPQGDSTQSRVDEILDPGRYYVMVDGATGGEGAYELFASVSELESAEKACEGARLLTVGATMRGSTRGLPDLFHATCGRGAHAGESVYTLEVPEVSRLRVIQQTEYDGVLHLRRRCEAPSTELACNDDFRGPNRSLLTAQVEPGTYYLFTDGLSRSHAGTYSLRAELTPLGELEHSRPRLQALCQGARALPLSPGVAGLDTFTAPSRQRGSCGGSLAPEAVYAFSVQEMSRVWVRLRAAEFNAVLYLRRHCTVPRSEVACELQAQVNRRPAAGQPTPHGLNVIVDPGEYFLFVDGAGAGDFGAAQMELAVTPVREVVEYCAAAPRIRPGEVIEGDTAGGEDLLRARCGGESLAAERVYRLKLERRSRVVIELESAFDAVLHLRRDCADVRSEVACNDDGAHDRVSKLDEILAAGEYFVVADGFRHGEEGPFRLAVKTVDLSPRPR